ncbi:MAG: hypothetical protein IPF66_10480 [Holophagales bacterium]|nr:hypothetical protein [Holophagales bacterium]
MSAVVARRGVGVAPEKGIPVRDDSRLTVTPAFAFAPSWTSSAAERSVPSKNSFGRSPAIVPRRKPALTPTGPLRSAAFTPPSRAEAFPRPKWACPAKPSATARRVITWTTPPSASEP